MRVVAGRSPVRTARASGIGNRRPPMMAVVADTSPLNYLVLIEAVEILPLLYKRICVPEAVIAELRSPDAPLPVRQWAVATAARGRASGLGAGHPPESRSGSHGRTNGSWLGAQERGSCDLHFGNTPRGRESSTSRLSNCDAAADGNDLPLSAVLGG